MKSYPILIRVEAGYPVILFRKETCCSSARIVFQQVPNEETLLKIFLVRLEK